ncbi:MAG: Os1348 family NHLP clan protein [Vicinamibacterales bacterium]
MAQRSIEVLIGRLITDEAFRTAFLRNRTETLRGFVESGHELTTLELAAVAKTRMDLWILVADQIDPRLQKASFQTGSQS